MINRNVEHLNAEFTELVNQQEDIISHIKPRQADADVKGIIVTIYVSRVV